MKTINTLSLSKLNDFFKRRLLYLSLFLLPGVVAGQDFNWVSQLSDGANLSVNSTIVDGVGNTYSVGYFSSTADFDPGPGTFNLTSGGGTDAFVLKLDANGNLVWAFHMPGASSGSATDVALDAAGNIIVVGSYQNATDFDPSASTFNLTWASGACFVAKYNPSGNFIWAGDFRTGGGISANSVATDASNNVYVAGNFSETPDFDPGSGTVNLTNAGGVFSGDGYICKLNSAGAFVWVRQLASSDDARCQGIAVDASGVYATGSFSQTCDFDPTGTVANLTSAGASDAFVLKWDQNGNYIWAKRIGNTAGEGGSDLTLDGSGNVITIGGFSGTVDFDPGAGVQNASSNGLGDIFIQKLDATGNFVWIRTFGGADNDAGFAITVDNVNNIYSTGYFNQTVDLDPTAGVQNATALGSYDMYVQKLDASGNFVWAQAMGGSAGDYGRGIAAAVDNIVYVGGFFNNTVDFDPSAGVNNLTSAGGLDGFVLNLSPSPEIAVSGNGLNITDGQTATSTADFTDFGAICTGNSLSYSFTIENTELNTNLDVSSITSSNANFTIANAPGSTISGGSSTTFDVIYNPVSAGTHTATITLNNNDVDENPFTFTLRATGLSPVSFTQSPVICAGASFTVGTSTYTTSGTYTDVLTAANGCDSTVTTNLTVGAPITSTQSPVICAGASFTVGTSTYTTSGTYTDVLTAANGCDSTVTTNLTVGAPITSTQSPVICAGASFTVGTSTYTTSGTYTDVLTAANGCDSTVTTNLTVSAPITSTQSPTICAGASFTVGTSTYTTSGTYTDVLTAANGCDSTVTTTLNISQPTTFSQTFDECQGFSVTVGGNTYNSTGVYTDVLTNAAGCDSTVTTTLNISQPTTFSQTFDECQGFSVTVGGNTYNSTGVYTDVLTNAAGCDSTVTTNLTIRQSSTFAQTFDECQGFSVTVGGNTYNTTGVYTDVLTNAAGCDSTVTTNLTVNPLPTVTFAAINPDTICEGASPINLTGGSPAGGTYSGNGVSGTSFDPATAGLGTQTITYSYTDANNCSNTASTDVEVALCASTSMQNVDYQIQVYPNPTTSTVNLSIEGLELEGLRLSVYDVLGRQIETRMVDEYIEVIDLGQLLDGVYLIRLEGPNTAFVQSVIKQ
jgi:hypothetical protein